MKTKLIAFDTEFTGLQKDTTLVSIGLTSLDEGKQFYAELTDYDKSYDDSWFLKHVKDNLLLDNQPNRSVIHDQGGTIYVKGNRTFVASELFHWLKLFDMDEIDLVTDVGHYDMTLFIDLFGGAFDLPDFIAPTYIDINQMILEKSQVPLTLGGAFDLNREDLLKSIGGQIPSGAKHNSLYDAIVIARLYNILKQSL